MAKRKATYQKTPHSTKRRKTAHTRSGYSTVARTRGVYSKGEMKYFDSELTTTNLVAASDWAGTELDPNQVPVVGINTLFAPTVGAGINQRIGKACKVLKIKINGMVIIPSQAAQANADSSSIVRIALVQDMQTNATQAQGEQIFTPAVTANTGLAISSFQNINNFGRFKVIKDKAFIFTNVNMAGSPTAADVISSGLVKRFKWTIKFRKPVQVRFNATNGGTIADIVDNSWHIIANCSSNQLTPSVLYYCRVCYKE